MNDDQLLRYSRHIFLDDFDIQKQQKLLDAHVLIIGAGGLACPAALYLASSGVGRISIADDDVVELSNLQRQIAHGETDIGRTKVASLAQSLSAINSALKVDAIAARLSGAELQGWVDQADVVLDCSDNFITRFAVNAACIAAKTPLVSAAVIKSEGQLQVFDLRDALSPCYRCLYDDNNSMHEQSCSTTGVIAPAVGIMGSFQALEALKLISGFGQLQTRLRVFDFKYNLQRELSLKKDPNCPACQSL